MLPRSKSCPGGLSQLSQVQNTFHQDRKLPKLGRHAEPYGSYVPHNLRRGHASGCHEQTLSKDKQSLSEYNPLTKPTSACLNRSRGDFLTQKGSTNQSAQVAIIPASLVYKEHSRLDLYLPRKSQDVDLPLETTLQAARERDREQKNESTECSVHGDLRFSASDSFLGWQGGKADLFPTLAADPLHMDSAKPCAAENVERKERTTLRKLWKKKKEKRRTGGLILLNVLAALYGSSNVANGLVTDAAPSLPVSLTSLVRFTSALIFFAPALMSAFKNRDMELLRAGVELGGLAFAATVIDSGNPTSGSSSSAALLFAFTVIFIPIMEFCSGRRSGSTLTRFATVAAISGMGLLEEEGFGWKGISCPQVGDLWGMAVSIISAIHIFRSESHCGRFDPLLLNAVQCGVLAILSLGWETLTTFDANALQAHDILYQVQSLPWAPLIYNGLVCFGLCSWLELHGLRFIHASTATLVYTTIPVWGAFLSYFARHEMPVESAIIGGLVIMITSVYAQMTTTKVDFTHLQNQKVDSTLRSSNLKPDDGVGKDVSGPDCTSGETNETTEKNSSHDYFPGALLTSQLKFPYYAAQAKGLLAEVKIKLAAIKSILLSTVSSSIVTSTTGTFTPGSPGVNSSSGTAPAAPSNINGANNLPPGSSTISSVTSHIAKIDMSTAPHVGPHGPDIVGPISSSGSDSISEVLKATHSTADVTAIVVNGGTHFVAVVTTGLESALIVVGSDIMFGYEEAEDTATVLERFVQTAVENASHTVAACVTGELTWLDTISSNFAESVAYIPQDFASGKNIFWSFSSYVADGVTDSVVQNVAPLLHHIQ